MINSRNHLLIVLCLLVTLQSQAQHSYGQQLQAINHQITVAYMQQDAAGLLRIYDDNATSMPEYHLTLFGKKAIADYLKKWMDSAKVNSYTRQTYNITEAGDYLVETGAFSNKYVLRNKAVDYEGKYLAIWQKKSDNSLQLISEITGATNYLQRADLPLSTLQIPDTTHFPKAKVDQTRRAIQSLNDQVAELVVQRKGKDFAKYYTTDAIYMPYYMPMQIGNAAIDAYYREHEDPNTVIDAVYIRPSRIIETADYVLVDGYYSVDWRGGNAHGTVTGKNINVWKRDSNGKLLLFRQMTVHD